MNKTKGMAQKNNETWYPVIVVMVLLNSMGFPGNYELVFGEMISTIVDYGCFLMEIFIMLISSGDDLLDIKIINLEKRYKGIYLVVAVFVIESMAVTRYPGLQLITCLRLATTVAFVLWICSEYEEEEILRLICIAQTLFVFSTVIFLGLRPGVAFNSISGELSFVGLYTTKNSAAGELCFGIIMFLIFFKNQRRQKKDISKVLYLSFVLQMVMIVLCHAAGAILTLVFTVIYLFVWMDKLGEERRIPLAWMFLLGSVGFLVAALTILPLFSGLFELIGKDATLTGRTPLWEQIIKVMQENHTLTGYGYAMFWRDEAAVELIHGGFDSNSFLGTMNTGAHNLLLECWLNVGLIGIFALFLGMFECMKKIRELTPVQYEICSGIFILSMIAGFTERSFESAYAYDIFFLFLAMGIACRRVKKEGG